MMLVPPCSLSQALKRVRRYRKLTVQQVADRMGLHKRTYEYFESQKGRLCLERIAEFARVTDSDVYAILIAAMIDAPGLAADCVETKALTLLLTGLSQVQADLSDALAELTARDLTSAIGALFADLITTAQNRRALRCALDRDASGDPEGSAPPPDS